jgi:hypothetical protein
MRNILGDCCRQRYIMLIERARKVVKRHIRNRVQHNLKMVVEMKEGDLGVNAVPFTYNKFRVGHIIPKFIQARIESGRRAMWAFTVRRTDIALLTTRRLAISDVSRGRSTAVGCARTALTQTTTPSLLLQGDLKLQGPSLQVLRTAVLEPRVADITLYCSQSFLLLPSNPST